MLKSVGDQALKEYARAARKVIHALLQTHEQRLDFAKGIILLESLYPKMESQTYHNPHDMMELLEEIESYGVEVPDIFHDWIQDLANKLEAITGVNLVSVDLAQSCWIDADNNDYGDWTTIDVRRIPESGYFTIENYNGISYEV